MSGLCARARFAFPLLLSVAGPLTNAGAFEPGAAPGTGLWGTGIGVGAPEVGIFGAWGRHDNLGLGRNFGAAISWQASLHWSVGVHVLSWQTLGGQAPLTYLDVNGLTKTVSVPAQWQSLSVALDVSHSWRFQQSAWLPYAGVVAGWMYGGYAYRFPDTLQNLEQIPQLAQTSAQCTDYVCPAPAREATNSYPLAGLRAGVALVLTEWLTASLDAMALGTITRALAVSNTSEARNVKSPAEAVLFGGLTFGARVVF